MQKPPSPPNVSPQQQLVLIPASSQIQQPGETRIPINTVKNIINNSPIPQQSLSSVLTKLPQLVLGTKQQSPIRQQRPVFAPTLQVPTVNASPHLSKDESSQNTVAVTSTNLSPEVKKFYGLLCKAILEPDIPLNRVTAYIAEKCLVRRFTGIIETTL